MVHDQKHQGQIRAEIPTPDEKPCTFLKDECKVDEEEQRSKTVFAVRKRSMSNLARRFACNTGLDAREKIPSGAITIPTKTARAHSQDQKRLVLNFWEWILEWRTK